MRRLEERERRILLVIDGELENLAIQRVVSFDISDEILLHDAKQLFTELETDGVDYDEIRELLEDLLGKKTVSVRYKDVLSTTEGQDRGRTRKDIGRTGRDNNADLSAEEKRKYALKKNKKATASFKPPGPNSPTP